MNDLMFIAIKIGAIKVVRLFLDHGGIDLTITGYDEEEFTLVQWAARHNQTEIVKLLINHGADTGSTVWYPQVTSLAEAVENSNVDIVSLLLKAGESSDTLYYAEFPVLNLAARENCIEIVRLLLEYGADVNATSLLDDDECLTALHSAVAIDNADMVCLLLEYGACTIEKGWQNTTPLEFSIIKEKKMITNILLTHVIIEKSLDSDIHEDILKILNEEMKNRGSSWEKELYNMKNEKICDGYNVSVYDVLRANQDEMLEYVRNEDIREALKMSDYSDKLYFHMLQSHIKRGLESLLRSILNNVRRLPDQCISKILSYFNNKDIQYLVESHKALSS